MYKVIRILKTCSFREKRISAYTSNMRFFSLSPFSRQADDFGVCFDIDGVISRGHVPFPEARTAYQLLMDHDRNIHIPSCFVTNSLGRNSCRAMQLTEWLGVTVNPEQMVLGQGPLEMYSEYHHKNCLIIGQGQLRQIAAELGFTNVYLMDEVMEAYPLLDASNHEKNTPLVALELNEKELPNIEALVLIGEPKHWECQLQILIDILLTNGKPSGKQNRVNYQTIPVIGCNVDLQYMHKAEFPRFGHGAFLLCLESLFKKLTGKDLEYSVLTGKPSEVTFRYAEHCLSNIAQNHGSFKPLKRMYMIGDNIDVDIAGANLYQRYINAAAENKNCALSASRQPPNNGIFLPQTVTEIYGILVKTGVSFASSGITHSHRDFTLDSDILKPHIILDNVLDAIQYIIKNES
ncbi:hypothetical protein LSH36_358g01038 [Paralvinella palmiformis]|uniref:Uncharacterized protein n=1 Tax=Paralvinella palmiformis TaxID=53620 RepID=A0AAD9N139_9ANNE|nr:hypothetical protein LSH36_358g01038 [Paralvinella palmiformis]